MISVGRFIENPNLPQTKVSLGIIDGRADDIIVSKLKREGIKVLKTEPCPDLYGAVSYHPDMFLHHVGGKIIVAAPNAPENVLRRLADEGFTIVRGDKYISRKYPDDIAYNVARICNCAVCSVRFTDRVLLKYLYEAGVKIIDVKQGYAKCSICIVDSKSVITSDKGIYDALNRHSFDVLLVSPGHISLPDLDYGFIGGASGLISNDIIFFSGDIKAHPDFEKIESFLKKHGKKICSVDDCSLTDLGTFVPLKENCIE